MNVITLSRDFISSWLVKVLLGYTAHFFNLVSQHHSACRDLVLKMTFSPARWLVLLLLLLNLVDAGEFLYVSHPQVPSCY